MQKASTMKQRSLRIFRLILEQITWLFPAYTGASFSEKNMSFGWKMTERASCKHCVFIRAYCSDLMTIGNNADEIVGDFGVEKIRLLGSCKLNQKRISNGKLLLFCNWREWPFLCPQWKFQENRTTGCSTTVAGSKNVARQFAPWMPMIDSRWQTHTQSNYYI